MPRSLVQGKSWISHEIARLRPTTLLDVGPGMGTYSNLLRDVTPGASWSCVEVFRPYVHMFELHRKYDAVVPVRSVLKSPCCRIMRPSRATQASDAPEATGRADCMII